MKLIDIVKRTQQSSSNGYKTGGEHEPCQPQPRVSPPSSAQPSLHTVQRSGGHRRAQVGSGGHNAGVGLGEEDYTGEECIGEVPTGGDQTGELPTTGVLTRESRSRCCRGLCCGVPLLLLLIHLLLLVGCSEAAGPQAECTTQQHCGPTQCCRLSGFRFSIPECSPRGVEGDWCRPHPDPHYRTSLIYPSGVELEVEEVYHVLCPCAPGYTCEDRSATCIPQQRDEEEQQQQHFDEGGHSTDSLQGRESNGGRPPVFYY